MLRFQFYNDTVPICGNLPEIPPFTIDEAMEAARIGASGIYHATCHAVVFDGEAATDILESLYKGAFFTLQALQYVRTGEYPHTKSEPKLIAIGIQTVRPMRPRCGSSPISSWDGPKASSALVVSDACTTRYRGNAILPYNANAANKCKLY